MATPTEKIAASLEVLGALQPAGRRIVKSEELSRVHRERLLKHGDLRQVMKGWLMLADPGIEPGDAAWRAAFREFCGRYCTDRFGGEWHLSPEQSLLLQDDAVPIPARVVVYTPHGTNNTLELPFGTSLYDLKYTPMAAAADVTDRAGVRLLTAVAALVRVPESFFVRHPTEAASVLANVGDASDVVRVLLEGGHSAVAGRLAGAFRSTGRGEIADEIVRTMKAAGYDVRERDRVGAAQTAETVSAPVAPLVARMQELWAALRETVVRTFPPPPAVRPSPDAYLRSIDDVYARDAYHSLAIEGYRVTPELIHRVRAGDGEFAARDEDRRDRDALAARGYWQAFQRVRETVARVVAGENAGTLTRTAHLEWKRELIQPFVAAGLIASTDDAGSLRGTQRTLSPWKAVRDAEPALFDLLEREAEASVRAVLGHWMFGYIHRYTDGDGRLARFLLNVMLASGGYPWTILRVEDRSAYVAALESASVDADVLPLARFVADRVRWSLEQQGDRYAVAPGAE